MTNICDFGDLRGYGIDALTGEACGLMMRILCDFDEKGRRVIGKWLGVPNFQGAEAWNSGPKDNPHVGSIMLDGHIIPSLAVFCLLENGYRWAVRVSAGPDAEAKGGLRRFNPHAVSGFKANEEEHFKRFLASAAEHGMYTRCFSYGGTAGDRNQHVMTGRVE